MLPFTLSEFAAVRARIADHIHHTPLLTSRQLCERTGLDVRLKAELFQRVGSYKIRGALYKFARMSPEQQRAGVICASAGNHAQGVAMAARIHGIRAVVCMAVNATRAKIEAAREYGAEVVLHGDVFDDANEHARRLAATSGMTYVHPFDDPDLIAGQGTLGLEIVQDWPDVQAVIVPIGGGGLISGVALAAKAHRPDIRVIGVEPQHGPSMKMSVEAGRVLDVDTRTRIDGWRVRRVGTLNLEVVRRYVDDIVTLSDHEIFDAMIWIMERCKLVAEGAGAASVAALLRQRSGLAPGTKVVCVLSGGNVDLGALRGMVLN